MYFTTAGKMMPSQLRFETAERMLQGMSQVKQPVINGLLRQGAKRTAMLAGGSHFVSISPFIDKDTQVPYQTLCWARHLRCRAGGPAASFGPAVSGPSIEPAIGETATISFLFCYSFHAHR